jgi:hypothetical protein
MKTYFFHRIYIMYNERSVNKISSPTIKLRPFLLLASGLEGNLPGRRASRTNHCRRAVALLRLDGNLARTHCRFICGGAGISGTGCVPRRRRLGIAGRCLMTVFPYYRGDGRLLGPAVAVRIQAVRQRHWLVATRRNCA